MWQQSPRCASGGSSRGWTRPPAEYGAIAAMAKLSYGKSGADADCPTEYWKALLDDSDLKALVHQIFVGMWESGSYGILDPANTPDKPSEPLRSGVGAEARRAAGVEDRVATGQPEAPGVGHIGEVRDLLT